MFNRRSFIVSALAAIAGLIGWKKVDSESHPVLFPLVDTKPHMPVDWDERPCRFPGARLFERDTGLEITEQVLRCNPDTGYYECCLPGLTGKPFLNADREIATEIRKAEGGIDIQWDA